MALDTDFSFGNFQLPSLEGPTEPPPRHPSRRLARHGSGAGNSSTAANAAEKDGEESGGRNGERISILDPRRFTPTLHANLVGEILALRRDVESKSKLVLNLEESLLLSKEENSKLNEAIAESSNETRILKRQMQLLEGGTLSAIEELAKERDKATENLAEVRKHLEASQKKARSKEEEVDRTNALWERDRENWDVERRNLDLKVHVVESRLKTVLSEIEAAQLHSTRPRSRQDLYDRPTSRASGVRSAASHHRRNSSMSTDGAGAKNYRLSHISEGDNGDGGTTLADELRFDEEEFSDDGADVEVPISPEALPEENPKLPRPFSALSHRQSVKARKLLGLALDDEEADENSADAINDAANNTHRSAVQHGKGPPTKLYTDTATQFSPPPSPTSLSSPVAAQENNGSEHKDLTHEPKPGHARDAADEPSARLAPATQNSEPRPVTMVSSACQTVEHPLSPPATPTNSKTSALGSIVTPNFVEMNTVSTQTLPEDIPSVTLSPAASRDKPSTSAEIPIIAIRPPTSSGSNRNSVALPPGTKNASCQASVSVSLRSVSSQTEGIRIDQRIAKLPPHLQPSSISSNPPSPASEKQQTKHLQSEVVEPARRTKLRPPSIIKPGSSKRLSKDGKEDPFVGFESGGDADVQSLGGANDDNISLDSFLHREPVRKTLSKVQDHWTTVTHSGDADESRKDDAEATEPAKLGGNQKDPDNQQPDKKDSVPRQSLRMKASKSGKVLEPINTSTTRPADIRRAALISSGTAAHAQRSRSPSLPAIPVSELQGYEPPFPVPARSSSRKFPWETDGAVSPTPGTVTFFSSEQGQRKHQRPPTKKPVLRKIRSATNEPYQPRRPRSRSPPPPTSASSYGPESPRFPHPPLPNDDIASPYRTAFKNQGTREGSHSGPPQSIAASAAESAGSEQTSVVDAIAQTMIGEWMWKYVRRRKSFGLPDNAEFDKNSETTNGIRHQRWVWLAPYERAVMWSSKQPMSGPALMGKSGRKLTIQSVLDVRDDAPLPKGAGSTSCFGRSILILTPQRALKFTATTRERHYIWLTALSFLSHSSVVPTELGSPMPEEFPGNSNNATLNSSDFGRPTSQSQPTTAVLRRHPIRDSIRVAKGKSRPPVPSGGRRAITSPTNMSMHALPQEADLEEGDEAAEAPHVPRTTSHTRKRSNTGPKSSFRSFASSNRPSLASFHSSSTTAVRPSTISVHSGSGGRGGGDLASEASFNHLSPAEQHEEMMMMPDWAAEPLSGAGGPGANFFDAVGTMRMEAFVRDRWVSGVKEKNPGGKFGAGGSVPSLPHSAPPIERPSAGERLRGTFRPNKQNRKKEFPGNWVPASEVKVGGSDPFEGF